MLEQLAHNWWLLLLRGLAAIIFGILCLVSPGITLLTLAIFYGAYVFADGIFALITAFQRHGKVVPTWWLIIEGLLGIAAGIATFMWPKLTAFILLFVVAAWAIVRGVFEIAGAIQLRKEIKHEWLLILNGAISILFGLFLIARPGPGILAVIWGLGIYAIAMGCVLIAFSFRMRGFRHEPALP